MNEQSIKQFTSDEMKEEGCCPRCREQPQCRKPCWRMLKTLLTISNFSVFDALNGLTHDNARRMVGG